MKLTPQRLLTECLGLALAVLLVIPLGVCLEQLFGYPFRRLCFLPCFSVLGYGLGRLSLRRSTGWSIALAETSVVGSVGAALFFLPGISTVNVLLLLLTAFFSLFFFFSARKAAYTIYAPMAITGIVLHLLVLLCCAGFGWDGDVSRFTSGVAIAFFLLSLFAFSSKALRRSVLQHSGDSQVDYPAGMQLGNFFLVAGFVLIAALLSNLYPLFRLFSRGFSYLTQGFLSLADLLAGLRDRLPSVQSESETTAAAIASNLLNGETREEPFWVLLMVEIVAFLCVAALLCYGVFKCIQKLRGAHGLPAFLRRLLHLDASRREEDYVDETESLFDRKKFLADARKNLKKRLRTLTERPQRFDDFPDNRRKVRFAFQQLLKKVLARTPQAVSETPNELSRDQLAGRKTVEPFMDYYNGAKYSDAPVPDAAVEAARAVLQEKPPL